MATLVYIYCSACLYIALSVLITSRAISPADRPARQSATRLPGIQASQ